MTASRFTRIVLGGALVVLSAAPWVQAGTPRCTDGRWTIDQGPVTVGKLTIGTIALRDGVPSLDAPCEAVRFILEQVEDATTLRALFICRTQRRILGWRRRFPLRLRARITDGCEHLLGAIGIRPLGQSVRFTATLVGDDCGSNADCQDDAYCAKATENCDGRGDCERRPLGCPDNIDPVCGCNGITYFNPCEASSAGVSVAHTGECGSTCGGIGGIPCTKSEFCELAPGTCGSSDLQGECVEVGEACPEFYSPVCGCDGETYANDCFRQLARVQKNHDGACGACTSVADCLPNEFCQSPEGQCGTAGECTSLLRICSGEYDPVCGCDGKTYVNRCHATNLAVSIAHAGTCERVCGGIAGIPCPEGEVCDLPAGECHSADLQGACVERPHVCPDLYAPVCGCDGVTYGNDCERLAQGVQKDHDGKCACVVPPTRCEATCDCYAALGQPACLECPLMCPNCGDYWQCKSGTCVQQCGPIPPDATVCPVDPTP